MPAKSGIVARAATALPLAGTAHGRHAPTASRNITPPMGLADGQDGVF
jgi:hypothetical protein